MKRILLFGLLVFGLSLFCSCEGNDDGASGSDSITGTWEAYLLEQVQVSTGNVVYRENIKEAGETLRFTFKPGGSCVVSDGEDAVTVGYHLLSSKELKELGIPASKKVLDIGGDIYHVEQLTTITLVLFEAIEDLDPDAYIERLNRITFRRL